MLTEDGRRLGPGGQLHQRIREQGGGLHAFNHSLLRFAASDNSDPRENGRVYRLDLPVMPGPLIWLSIAIGLGLAAVRLIALPRGSNNPVAAAAPIRSALAPAAAAVAGAAASAAACFTFGSVRLSAESYLLRAVAAAAAAAALLVLINWWKERRIAARQGGHPSLLTAAPLAPYLLLRILCCLGVAFALLYLAGTIAALIGGWALPTTALFRWSPVARWLARREEWFGLLLLGCAALGSAGTWVALLARDAKARIEQEEVSLARMVRICGPVVVTCVLTLSLGAMWAGIIAPGLLQPFSIGGLIPFNDALGYVAGAYDQAANGALNTISLRRPLAEAFRSVLLLLSGFSYPLMLFVQTCLLSLLTCLAAWSIARWRGLWAGVGFLGLTCIYIRAFAPTALTEPLGLCWALFAIPFLVEALRSGSQRHALLALAAITTGLMTRMGAMFTIPALILWLVYLAGRSWRSRAIGATAAILTVLVVVAGNALLARSYGSAQDHSGENFSYVLCGLTLGTTWEGCWARLQERGQPMPGDEASAVRLMYAMAWENFKQRPEVLIERLTSGAIAFVSDLPDQLFRGYLQQIPDPDRLLKWSIAVVCIAGLVFLSAATFSRAECAFWSLFWLSTVASAAFVHFDDGGRVLAVSYVLIALFFSLGFANPALPAAVLKASRPRLFSCGIGVFAAMALLLSAAPWLAQRLSPARSISVDRAEAKGNQELVLGGRLISGFLVVPDGAPERTEVPTVDFSTFADIIRASGVEQYQGLLTPRAPQVPFGFVFAPRADGVASYFQYVVPPEVLERRDVRAWRFDSEEWQRKPPNTVNWFLVTHAEPLR